ncbi:hypothetical protein F5Y15DRAFT_414628 [Xylariaceae sp. FL0016]|nr:hypothetical protein F5Y15DRAFT_414628 [Xylariaceae sp. FL0016]
MSSPATTLAASSKLAGPSTDEGWTTITYKKEPAKKSTSTPPPTKRSRPRNSSAGKSPEQVARPDRHVVGEGDRQTDGSAARRGQREEGRVGTGVRETRDTEAGDAATARKGGRSEQGDAGTKDQGHTRTDDQPQSQSQSQDQKKNKKPKKNRGRRPRRRRMTFMDALFHDGQRREVREIQGSLPGWYVESPVGISDRTPAPGVRRGGGRGGRVSERGQRPGPRN